MDELKGRELEDFGQQLFTDMDFLCIHRLNQVRLLDIDPTGPYSGSEHLEIDFLIPFDSYCLVGEITGRVDPRDVRRKYSKFREHYAFLLRHVDRNLWSRLGVDAKYKREFRSVKELRGFFITSLLEKFDVSLSEVTNIARFYKSDWKLLVDYVKTIGHYTQQHFLHRFDVSGIRSRHPLLLDETLYDLMQTKDRKVASGVGLADVYTFEASPYEILPMAQVFRRDELPDLSPEPASNYQRPLDPAKLGKIRRDLLVDEDFMFPSSILVVLSNDCRYFDDTKELLIPNRYGALSIIDGQHRLFSYADQSIEENVDDESKIMVTAIQFKNVDEDLIQKYSAHTFVEINTNQTKVARSHIDAIAYDILGRTKPRDLAAKIVLEANERKGSLYGFFDTNRTGLGIVKATTVLSSLTAITNLGRIERLQRAQSGSTLARKEGYENLFDVDIAELADAEMLIQQGIICIERYFNLVKSVFPEDWPERLADNHSSLRYAKVIAGFVKLLWKDFISEGSNWDEVEEELRAIRSNVLSLRGLNEPYDDMVFNPKEEHIPNSDPRANDDYRFLHANRSKPTSIQIIVD